MRHGAEARALAGVLATRLVFLTEVLMAARIKSYEIEGLYRELKLPRFRRVMLDLGDYGSVVTASIAAS